MPDPPNSLPAVVRFTRTVWAMLLVSQFLYILAGRKILLTAPALPARPDPSLTIGIAIAAACALCLVLIFSLRFVRRASETLQSNPTDAAAIAR